MTRAKKAIVQGTDPKCECGEIQSVYHLLWECELVAPPSLDIAYRKDIPPAQSVAHILPLSADSREVVLWKTSCLRAIQIVSRREWGVSVEPGSARAHRDQKGHSVAVTSNGSYTYCMKCFISRRSRDAGWIFLKTCDHEQRGTIPEGGTVMKMGHACTLILQTWKVSAKRPQLLCNVCGQKAWATSGFRRPCLASGADA